VSWISQRRDILDRTRSLIMEGISILALTDRTYFPVDSTISALPVQTISMAPFAEQVVIGT
jgi:hypothetical protein